MPKKSEAISEATALGIEFNPRWPKIRILALIDKARKSSNPLPNPPETTQPELQTTQAEPLEDRMMRYGKNPVCSVCGAHPVVITMRRGSYSAFRCRSCEHRWEG